MKPILLEVVAKMMTSFDQCHRCKVFFDQTGMNRKIEQNEIDEYPPDMREENRNLLDWMRELNRLYKHRLSIKLIDAPSLLGIYKSLRYRIRTYPTFIVEGKETYTGWDKSQLESLLDKYIHKALPSKHRRLQPSPS